MSFSSQISKDSILALDKAKMADAIAGMGGHLRDASIRSREALDRASLPQKNELANIILAGLGGSAIGGDLARSYLLSKLSVPFLINRTYDLPGFAGEQTMVIASSYSGSTEESLSMFEAAQKCGAKIICITTGGKLGSLATEHRLPMIVLPTGFQPRAALAYSFVPVLLTLERIGFTSGETGNIQDAADLLDKLSSDYGISNLTGSNQANMLAHQLFSRI
ncbi:MAG: bifunctional phosphoglucose/phosphomannose isomerase, partial [Bacteroidota bacterium]|nr:bifunctional phosphoglucose/phosphomannose isomerase [Bacteroidota bacterium]